MFIGRKVELNELNNNLLHKYLYRLKFRFCRFGWK